MSEELSAENERLRAENENLRRWKAMDKPLTAAMAVVSNDMQRLRADCEQAAAFLDELACYLESANRHRGKLLRVSTAADCRAMARKLREYRDPPAT